MPPPPGTPAGCPVVGGGAWEVSRLSTMPVGGGAVGWAPSTRTLLRLAATAVAVVAGAAGHPNGILLGAPSAGSGEGGGGGRGGEGRRYLRRGG